MAVIWSSTNKCSVVSISGGGLIATGDTVNQTEVGRTDTFISGSQKVHWEVIFTNNTINGGPGFANVSFDATLAGPFMGGDVNSTCYYGNGQYFAGGSQIATLAAFVSGDVLAIEVDFALGKAWFANGAGGWNNDILANQNPATGTGGIALTVSGSLAPTYQLAENAGTPGVATARFLAASFTRAISSGFVALDAGDTLMAQAVM